MLIKISQNLVFSAATTKSAARARFAPPPTATPFSMAITGCGISRRVFTMRPTPFMATTHSSEGMLPAKRLISAPEQKWSPAPLRITTRMLSSAARSFTASHRSSIISLLMAFITSGRFNVRVAILSFISTITGFDGIVSNSFFRLFGPDFNCVEMRREMSRLVIFTKF